MMDRMSNYMSRSLQHPSYIRMNGLYSQQDAKLSPVSSGTKHKELPFQSIIPKNGSTDSLDYEEDQQPLTSRRDFSQPTRLSSNETMVGANFQTVVRIRPSAKGSGVPDENASSLKIINMDEDMKTLIVNRNLGTAVSDRYPTYQFNFDRVFDEYTNQQIFYQSTCRPLVRGLFSGNNSTIFAYGQTRSGKKHTLEGVLDSDRRGIIPRVVEDIFATLRTLDQSMNAPKFNVKVCYIQVYNDVVSDLLNPNTHNLKIIDDKSKTASHISGAKYRILKDPSDIYNILKSGRNNRGVASGVKPPDLSARSHSVLSIMLEQVGMNSTNLLKSKIHFVTLAGAERARDFAGISSNSSKSDDGAKIAMTFNALATIIAFLSRSGSRHIPYRDSKLTHILKDSLSNNALCLFIATIYPIQENYNETLASLKYASRIRQSSTLITTISPSSADGEINTFMGSTDSTNSSYDNHRARMSERSQSVPNLGIVRKTERQSSHPSLIIDRPLQVQRQDQKLSQIVDSPVVQQSPRSTHFQPKSPSSELISIRSPIRPQQLQFSPTRSDVVFDEYTRSPSGQGEELTRELVLSPSKIATELLDENESLKEAICNMKIEIEELNNQKEEYKSQTEKLNQIVKKLAQERLTFKQSYEEFEEENNRLKKEISTMAERLDTQQPDSPSPMKVGEIYTENLRLDKEISELKGMMLKVSNNLASAEIENLKLKTNIEELTISNEELSEKKQHLEKIVTVKGVELIELQKTLDQLRFNTPVRSKSPLKILARSASSPSVSVTFSPSSDASVNTEISSVDAAIVVSEVEDIVQRSKELEETIDRLELRVAELMEEKERINLNLSKREEEVSEIHVEIEKLTTLLPGNNIEGGQLSLLSSISELSSNMNRLREERNELKSKLIVAEERMTETSDKLEKKRQDYESDVKVLTENVQKLINELKIANVESEKLRDSMPDKKLEDDRFSLLSSLSELSVSMNRLKEENIELKSKLATAEINLADRVEDYEKKTQSYQTHISELTTRLDNRIEEIKNNNIEMGRLKVYASAPDRRIEDDRVSLISSISELNAKVNGLRDERDDLKVKISMMETNTALRIDEYEKKIETYEGDIRVLTINLESAMEAISKLKQHILTIDNELNVANQSCNSQSELITQLETETKELEAEIETLRNECRIKDTTLLEQSTEIENLKLDMKSMDNRVKQMESEQLILKNQVDNLNVHIDCIQSEKDNNGAELNRLKIEVEEYYVQVGELENEKEVLKTERNDLHSQLKSLHLQISEEQNERRKLQLQFADAKSELESLSSENSEAKNKMVQYELILMEKNCEIDRLMVSLSKAEDSYMAIVDKLNVVQDTNSEDKSRLELEILRLYDDLSDRSKQMQLKDASLFVASSEMEKLKMIVEDTENELEKVKQVNTVTSNEVKSIIHSFGL